MITTLPIQGTFDIARGRTCLRTHIAANRWHPTVNARASAMLTALGELILYATDGRLTPVRVEIITSGVEMGLRFMCELHINEQNVTHTERIGELVDQLERTADGVRVTGEAPRLHVESFIHILR